jgi:hypothetical protein
VLSSQPLENFKIFLLSWRRYLHTQSILNVISANRVNLTPPGYLAGAKSQVKVIDVDSYSKVAIDRRK